LSKGFLCNKIILGKATGSITTKNDSVIVTLPNNNIDNNGRDGSPRNEGKKNAIRYLSKKNP